MTLNYACCEIGWPPLAQGKIRPRTNCASFLWEMSKTQPKKIVLRGENAKAKGPAKSAKAPTPTAQPQSSSVPRLRTGHLAPSYPGAPRALLGAAVTGFNDQQSSMKLGSTSMSGLLSRAHAYVKKHHPNLHRFAAQHLPGAAKAVLSHLSSGKGIVSKVAHIVEREMDGPAERCGRLYGAGLADPFNSPPGVVPDIKLYRTGSMKCPTETTVNTVLGTGTDTSYQSGGAVTSCCTQSLVILNGFANGLASGSTTANDTSLTFLTANALSLRQVHAGMRIRNTSSALNRQGRFVVLRAPYGSLAGLNGMTFGAICALNFAHVGDFADQESFVFRWVPAGTSDLAFVAPTATPASDNTMIYWRASCAAAQTIEMDSICCYEYRAIVAQEVGLPVCISIGSESAAAHALNNAVASGLLDDTRDPLNGSPIKTWAGGSHAVAHSRDGGGQLERSNPPAPNPTASPVSPEIQQYHRASFAAFCERAKSLPFLWNVDQDGLRELWVAENKSLPYGNPGNQDGGDNEWLKNAAFMVLGIAAPEVVGLVEGIDLLSNFFGSSGAVGSDYTVGYRADRLLAFASSLSADDLLDMLRAVKLGYLSMDVLAPFSQLFQLDLKLGPRGLDYHVGGEMYKFRLSAEERDLYGRLVQQPHLVKWSATQCPNCPPEFDCHSNVTCKGVPRVPVNLTDEKSDDGPDPIGGLVTSKNPTSLLMRYRAMLRHPRGEADLRALVAGGRLEPIEARAAKHALALCDQLGEDYSDLGSA